jgi:predicted SprT family Zn-dependent metalloprotease
VDLARLTAFADARLREHGLYEQGWRFRLDHARQRFGTCRYRQRLITVSRYLAALNGEAECRDTVLHEIAHALAGPAAGHGPRWKQMCRRVGAKPERCFDAQTVRLPAPRYWGICPHCCHHLPYYRRPRTPRACGPCCHRYSGGHYDDRFRLDIRTAA